MDTSWKVVYNYNRERRCSSSTLSAGAGSTPTYNRFQNFDAMEDIQEAPVFDDDDFVAQLELQTEDELWEFINLAQAGQAKKFRRTTHLKIVLNSTDFGDWEDDIWCMFLANFEDYSHKVTHLSIYIEGPNVFTRNNYVKPEITIQEEVLPAQGKGKGLDHELGLHYPVPVHDDDLEKPPSKKPKFTRSTMNSTANADFMPASLNTPAAPPTKKGPIYITKKVPSHLINLHIYEKAIIPALINVFKNHSPRLSFITIQGPMELSLRRHIISSINPSFTSNTTLNTEAGYAPTDAAAIAEVQTWEAGHPEMALLRRGVQDPDDFGQWNKQATGMQSVNMHGLGEWIVPSGKGARGVWGWKTQGPGVKVWRGPGVGWAGREGV